MRFGDDAFTALLRSAQREDGSFRYEELHPYVEYLARPRVIRLLRGYRADPNDVLQNVHIAVWQGLPRFLAQVENNVPEQRRAWLYRICKNKANDAIRAEQRMYRMETEIDDSLVRVARTLENRLIHLENHAESQRHINEFIYLVCQSKARPESKLAFLYNRVMMPLQGRRAQKNGDPRKVALLLEGKPLGQIRATLERDLTLALGFPLDPGIFHGLDQDLAGQEEKPFFLTERQITTASSSIRSRVGGRMSEGRSN